MILAEDTAPGEPDPSQKLYEPWLFLKLLDQLSSQDVGIGLIYSILELLARRYELSDVVVVLRDESLGTQAFRLHRRNLSADSPAFVAGEPGVFCDPDSVPKLVGDVVRNVCQLALTVHLARYGAEHDPLTNIANRQRFESTLRSAAVQSSRYGWAFALVLVDLNRFEANSDREVSPSEIDELMRLFGRALRLSMRSGDVATRIGGDNFAIILWNAQGSDVLSFVERLRDQLAEADDLHLTIGTASAPRDSTDPDELSRIAAGRLYEKKGSTTR